MLSSSYSLRTHNMPVLCGNIDLLLLSECGDSNFEAFLCDGINDVFDPRRLIMAFILMMHDPKMV